MPFIIMPCNLIVALLADCKVSLITKIYKPLLRSVPKLMIAYKSYLCIFRVWLNIPPPVGLTINVALFFETILERVGADR